MHLLPKRHRWATLEAVEIGDRVGSRAAVALARTSTDARRVVLFGGAGTGKTSLAIAIGRSAAAARDVNAMYATALQLDRARREARLGGGDAELVQRAIDVPVLVLDEVGADERLSTAVVDVIHERHDHERQTIATLALTPKATWERYSDGVARRLFGGAVCIKCDAEKQPEPKSGIERVRATAAWTPSAPRRAPGVEIAEDLDPTELRRRFDAFVAEFGLGAAENTTSPGPLRDVDYAAAEGT